MPDTPPAAAPAPAKPVPAVPSQTEEDRFFEFTKKYVGLLAAVASIPLVSGALGVLEPPPSHKALSVLASALSIVTFGAVYLTRSLLAKVIRSAWRSIIPAVLVLAGIAATALCGQHYLKMLDTNKPSQAAASNGTPETKSPLADDEMVWYLAIYPCFSFSLAMLAVTAFTQQKANTIQTLVVEQLMDEADQITERLSNLSQFKILADGNTVFRDLGRQLIVDENSKQLKSLAEGVLNLTGERARQLQMIMQNSFSNSFDAVSRTDLAFWRPGSRDAFATEYLNINAAAVKNKTRVNRIFLLEDSDLLQWKTLRDILIEQNRLEIGWGVAPMKALDPQIKGENLGDLDFALFDFDRAVSYFRDANTNFRRLEVMFNVENADNKRTIVEQSNRFLELVTQCWFVNQKMAEDVGGRLAAKVPDVKQARSKMVIGSIPRSDEALSARMTPDDWFRYIIAGASQSEAGKYEPLLTAERREVLRKTVNALKVATLDKPSNANWKDCFMLGVAEDEKTIGSLVTQTLLWRMSASDWKEQDLNPLKFALEPETWDGTDLLFRSNSKGFEWLEESANLEFAVKVMSLPTGKPVCQNVDHSHQFSSLAASGAAADHRICFAERTPGQYRVKIRMIDAWTPYSSRWETVEVDYPPKPAAPAQS